MKVLVHKYLVSRVVTVPADPFLKEVFNLSLVCVCVYIYHLEQGAFLHIFEIRSYIQKIRVAICTTLLFIMVKKYLGNLKTLSLFGILLV